MPLEHTPLDPATLSDAAKKALGGAGPMKMMAARGLAPLPRPADLASVIYQLGLDGDANVKAAAQKTAGELPEKILGGALSDATLDPRVLDFFALKVLAKPALVDALILNKATSDETMRDLASKVGERETEMIATNEQRLLRAPAIIGALYMNAKARMSTVDRVVELAVRNQVTVPGIPAWDEVVAAVLGLQKAGQAAAPADSPQAAAADAAFTAVAQHAIGEEKVDAAIVDALLAEGTEGEDGITTTAAVPGEVDEKKTAISKLSIPAKIRLATLGNAFARSTLVRDSNKQVALAAIRSPGVSENEVVKYSSNRALSDDVIRVIVNTKEWTKLYSVKLNLVSNPKCPLPNAMRLLPFLHDKDLAKIAKSKGIPSALATQARKLLAAKTGGK